MTHRGDESRPRKDSFHEQSVMNRWRAVVWILVAFVFLIVGLAGGAALFAFKREWAWLIPAASVGGYLLSFRRGMLLGNPAIDRTWRRYFCLEREVITGEEEISSVEGDYLGETLTILGPEKPRPQRHELRLVR